MLLSWIGRNFSGVKNPWFLISALHPRKKVKKEQDPWNALLPDTVILGSSLFEVVSHRKVTSWLTDCPFTLSTCFNQRPGQKVF